MGFTSIMSPNRFGSPRFTQGPSVFNLNNNIDEIQNPINFNNNNLGKPPPPSSTSNMMKMNNPFDDYLKDEKFNQKFMVNNPSSSSSSSSSPPQSSVSVNLNRPLSSNNKAVNEEWREIVQQHQGNVVVGENNDEMQQIKTIGDQSIEEFLINNGAINPVNNPQDIVVSNPQTLINIDPMVAGSQQQPDWLQFSMAQQMGIMPCLPVSGSLYGNPTVVDVGYVGDNQLSLSVPMPMNGTPSSDSKIVAEKKRRITDEMMEKTIERRQKRMIKNRESAARSRAKKQAYTNELERKLAELEKENERLTKEKEMAIMQLRMEPKQCPKKQLCRSSSAPILS